MKSWRMFKIITFFIIIEIDITKFESDLYRLAFMEGSLYQLYMEFPQIEEGETFYSFKSLIRELAVIKLYSFLQSREYFLEDLVSLKKELIDESLRPLWEPVFKQKEGMRLLRNKYLAHIQEQNKPFEKTIEEIIYETKIKCSWSDITFYCGCALNYCRFVKANFQKEFESAREKYFKSIPTEALLPQFEIKHIKNPDTELLDGIKISIKNLQKNNLVFEIPPPKNWSFTYTEDYNDSTKS